MTKKSGFLSKNLIIFAISGFLPKLISFFLVPIYTNYLTTAEYGTADLLSLTVSLLIPIFTLTIYDSVFRFSMDKQYEQRDVLSQSLKVMIFGTLIVGILSFICSFIAIDGFTTTYLIFIVVMFFLESLNNIFTRFCRAINRVGTVAVSGVVNSVVAMVCNIVFLVGFGWGVKGYLFAYTIGQFFAVIICFFGARLYRFINFQSKRELLIKMIKFSSPMIFSALAWWINNASDRYILTWLCGISVSGIYAVSGKIPTLLSSVHTIFNQAWSISAIREFDKEDRDGFLGSVYTNFSLVMTISASIIMIFCLPLVKILFGSDFFIAWKYTSPLVLAVFFSGLSLYLDGLFLAVNDTKVIAICNIIGALVNTALNFLLIYFFGAYGAAFSTVIGFGISFLLRSLLLKKYIRLKVNYFKNNLAIICLCLQVVLALFGWAMLMAQVIVLFIIISLYSKEIRALFKDFLSKIQKGNRNL